MDKRITDQAIDAIHGEPNAQIVDIIVSEADRTAELRDSPDKVRVFARHGRDHKEQRRIAAGARRGDLTARILKEEAATRWIWTARLRLGDASYRQGCDA
jgi:hypothetical protein